MKECLRSAHGYRLNGTITKTLYYGCLVLLIIVLLVFLLVFVAFPITFKHSVTLQRYFIFNTRNLPTDDAHFERHRLAGVRNLRVPVDGVDEVLLGVWHILPKTLIDSQEDYDAALRDGTHDTILYFHGNGETRADSIEKYKVLRRFFHVIAFDYRGFGDSTKAIMTEEAVIDDCMQIYYWTLNHTNRPIYVWGHSLGTALATRTVAKLKQKGVVPKGLFLEAPFTKMSEELYYHPLSKIFAWLPWFETTVIDPLQESNLLFETEKYILQVTCAIIILHAEDDDVVSVKFSRRLYNLVKYANTTDVSYYEIPSHKNLRHQRIYSYVLLPRIIQNVINRTSDSDNV